jgi:hypothetical protein
MTKQEYLASSPFPASPILIEALKAVSDDEFDDAMRYLLARKKQNRRTHDNPEGQIITLLNHKRFPTKNLLNKLRPSTLMAKNTKTVIVKLSETLIASMDAAQELLGYSTRSSLIQSALVDYIGRIERRTATPLRSVESRDEQRDKYRDKKKHTREEELKKLFLDILEELGGTYNDDTGYATYYTYSYKTRYEQVVPLNHLTRELITEQYQPSKEKVLQLQEQGKTDY